VPAGGLPLLIEEEGHVVSEVYRIRGDLIIFEGDQTGPPAGTRLCAAPPPCFAGLWTDQRKRADERDLLGPIYGWFTEVHYTRSQVC
jgi:hypothetical protein